MAVEKKKEAPAKEGFPLGFPFNHGARNGSPPDPNLAFPPCLALVGPLGATPRDLGSSWQQRIADQNSARLQLFGGDTVLGVGF